MRDSKNEVQKERGLNNEGMVFAVYLMRCLEQLSAWTHITTKSNNAHTGTCTHTHKNAYACARIHTHARTRTHTHTRGRSIFLLATRQSFRQKHEQPVNVERHLFFSRLWATVRSDAESA